LTSNIFQQGKLKLVYAALTNADSQTGTAQYLQLIKQMTSDGFSSADLADGWAINAYDALGTVAQASQTLSARQAVTRGQINSAVSGLSTVGAGGHISFDAAGDRVGDPPVLRLCPAPMGKPVFTVSATATSC
jgi:ABC-type branched-subunit amino acid transport system substrate-binding protein